MAKLWLTYAWKDNETDDVDHIIAELRAEGVDVRYDRAQLVAGQRLWQQIDQNIRDPEVTAWAIYTTENSLKSEPCQEELAYALDRTLRARGANFPLIGLFPGSFDSQLIPSALATRLCVNLHDQNWVEQVSDALAGTRTVQTPSPVLPFGWKLHKLENCAVLEVWPRTGTWAPFIAVVSENEASRLAHLTYGPRGQIGGISMVATGDGFQKGMFGRVIEHPITSAMTGHIVLDQLPTWIEFGQMKTQLYRIEFEQPTEIA